MGERRIRWKLFPSYLIVTLCALAAAVWFVAKATEKFLDDRTEVGLTQRGRIIERDITAGLRAGDHAGLDAFCKERGKDSGTRLTVILADGRVVADSDEDPAAMENHKDRREIAEALAGRPGRAVRRSTTMHRDMMYVALPLVRGGAVDGVLRVSMPLALVTDALRPFLAHLCWGAVLIAAIAALVALWIAHRIAAPLEALRAGAERFAQGDLSSRLPHSGIAEIERVGAALNAMAAELDERLRTVVAQRNELDAIVASMAEGVIAVDNAERVISMNAAAACMLGVDGAAAARKTIQEAVRNPALQDAVARALAADEPVEAAIVVHGEGERFLKAHGAVLHDAGGARAGAVIVLNDVTRIARLENLRREFVANVSHELRTPITSIKGFVETLQAGAIRVPEEAERFLGIVAAQVERLDAIIGDLLLLSSLDEAEGPMKIPVESHTVREVLESAVQVCAVKAGEKRMGIVIECDPDLRGMFNAPLLEQAVVNLVDNAVKWSDASTRVVIAAREDGGEVVITVQDRGCGVSKEDVPRIFERFYRVDRARSRKLGGTGLGLSIVKHIAQVHGGRVMVDSELGSGSTFGIAVPAR
ncbi:MAG TPA: PAS domain-containing sensor histidine kinase [Planctomycetes bacterium]|nr:PAS domain-containing sensor histidine kinase [Planctomycetota bacterium]